MKTTILYKTQYVVGHYDAPKKDENAKNREAEEIKNRRDPAVDELFEAGYADGEEEAAGRFDLACVNFDLDDDMMMSTEEGGRVTYYVQGDFIQ